MPEKGRMKFGMYNKTEKLKDQLTKCTKNGLWVQKGKACIYCGVKHRG